MPHVRAAAGAAALVLAVGCTAAPAPVDTPPASPPPVASSPAPPSAPRPEAPAPDARLVRRRAEPLGGRGYAQLGLTGANKPNGMEYRLR
jgi:hypothetical protein